MPLQPTEPWLFRMLAVVRTRPAMWIPGSQTVRNLETYLFGYRQSRADLGLPCDDGEQVLDEFASWLGRGIGCDKKLNWAGMVEEINSGDENIRVFFDLFEEFLREGGSTLPAAEDAHWPADNYNFKR